MKVKWKRICDISKYFIFEYSQMWLQIYLKAIQDNLKKYKRITCVFITIFIYAIKDWISIGKEFNK